MSQKTKSKNMMMARAIVEIAGKPKDYIEKAMKLVMERLKSEKGIKTLKIKVHEAKENSGVFNTFADIELEFKDFDALLLFCFEYMPSSIEFTDPEEITMDMLTLTGIFNDLVARLHQTDMKLKNVNAANIILERNAGNLLKTTISLTLRDGEKSIEEISKAVGIVGEQLKPFIEAYEKEGVIKKRGERYSL